MLKRIILILIILSFFLVSLYPIGASWLASHTYRKLVTVQHAFMDGDLSHFPTYVYLDPAGSGADLAAKIRNDGFDIVFTDNDGDTVLTHEREYYTEAGADSEGFFWVDIPNLYTAPAGDQNKIYMYYGDADAGDTSGDPWDANFTRVYHLRESGDGSDDEFVDSSGNALHGTGGGHEGAGDGNKTPAQATVKIYKGQDFDGTNDWISLGINQPISNSETRSCWISWDDVSTEDARFIAQNYTVLDLRGDGTNLRGRLHDGAWRDVVWASSNLSDGVLYYVTMTWDAGGGTVKLYVDADLKNTNSDYDGTPGDTSENLGLGATRDGSTPATDGKMDEVRFSDTDRGVDWIKFEYHNMTEGDNELTWGGEESAPENGEEENAIFFGINFGVQK